jgi:solute carrier family 35, member E3
MHPYLASLRAPLLPITLMDMYRSNLRSKFIHPALWPPQVGFYQIAKLCVIPFVACVEFVAYSRRFSAPVISSIALVIVGVGIVTVSDVEVNFGGLNVAVLSIVAAGSQQLLCRHQQTSLGITSNEMLLYTAWPMALVLLLVGPGLDWVITGGDWVLDFPFQYGVVIVILATCALGVGVNLSQFMCLGRFTAVAYQVRPP